MSNDIENTQGILIAYDKLSVSINTTREAFSDGIKTIQVRHEVRNIKQ